MSGNPVRYGDQLFLHCQSQDGTVDGVLAYSGSTVSGEGQYFIICPSCLLNSSQPQGGTLIPAAFTPVPAKTSEVNQPPFSTSDPFDGLRTVPVSTSDVFYLGQSCSLNNFPINWDTLLVFLSSTGHYSELHSTNISNYAYNGQIQASNIQSGGPSGTFTYSQTTFQLSTPFNNLPGPFYANSGMTIQGYPTILPASSTSFSGDTLLTFTFLPAGSISCGGSSIGTNVGTADPIGVGSSRKVTFTDPPSRIDPPRRGTNRNGILVAPVGYPRTNSIPADPPPSNKSDPLNITIIALIIFLVLILIGSIAPFPFLSCRKH